MVKTKLDAPTQTDPGSVDMPTSPSTWAQFRDLLGQSQYRRLLGIRLFAQSGDGAVQAGLASLVFFSPERSATAMGVAVAVAITVLPYSIIGPFAGVILDRFARRELLVAANVARAVLTAGMALGIALGISLVWVATIFLVVLALNRFVLAGLSASLPGVISGQHLMVANSVTPPWGTLSAALGTVVALILRRIVGANDTTDAVIVAIGAALYVASALVTTTMNRALMGPDTSPTPDSVKDSTSPTVMNDSRETSGKAETALPRRAKVFHIVTALRTELAATAEGVTYLAKHPVALRVLGSLAAHRLVFGAMLSLMVVLSRNVFRDPHDPDAGLALVSTAMFAVAVGFTIAVVTTNSAVARTSIRWWLAFGFIVGTTGVGIFALVGSEFTFLVAAAAVGFSGQGSKIITDSVLMAEINDTHRGRVFAIYDTLFNVCLALSAAIAALFLQPPLIGDAAHPLSSSSLSLVVLVLMIYVVGALWASNLRRGAFALGARPSI